MLNDFDYSNKIIIIGDSATGKSSLMNRFCYEKFNPNFVYTIGMEMGHKNVIVNEKKVKVTVFDTAGQERFRSITQSYYRGADAAIIVYDVTCLESFNHVRSWLKDLYNYSDSEIKKVLVGNKVDQKDSRRVSYDEGKKLADDYGILFFETSAFDGQNVEEAFVAAVKEKKEPRKTSFTPSQVEEILLTEQAGDDSSDEGGKKTTSSSCKC